MAFVSVAGGGTGVIAGASASSFTITTTAAIDLSASRFCLVPVTSDNIATSDGATNTHTSITGGTGTWTKLGEYTNSNAAAAAGVTTSLWLFVPSGTNATGTVFTVTLSSAVVDACAQTRIFSWDSTKGIRQTTEAAVVGNGVDASNDFGSVAFSGLTSLARLYFRALGKEANSTTNVTASPNFAAGTAVRSRNNAAAVLSRTEWRINTSTGETSNPTLAVTGDTAAIFAALEEYTPAGSQTLSPPLTTNTNQFYAATVVRGAVALSPSLTTSTNQFYAATVSRGAVALSPTKLSNTNQFYATTVSRGAVALSPTKLSNTNQFYAATVSRGAVALLPTKLGNTSQFYAATVSRGAVALLPTKLSNTNQFYSATVVRGAVALAPAKLSNTSQFYAATVSRGTVALLPSLTTNTNQFYAAFVSRGAVALLPTLTANTSQFYAATVTVIGGTTVLSPPALPSANLFPGAALGATYPVPWHWYDARSDLADLGSLPRGGMPVRDTPRAGMPLGGDAPRAQMPLGGDAPRAQMPVDARSP